MSHRADEARIAELTAIVRDYVRLYPPFVSKPIGAPGSQARQDQNEKIDLDRRAKAAL